ncbi:hypothetical protein DY000_02064356 [Brassica cretica]|uniref:Uncharacterized protein n=1 Tax=Brassica cretica TaxID=69181 RepID=A0ABQ7B3Z5_BRACR|nr:hypothetical protein DY000_02064356 [Brassica cretica]
MRKSLRTRGLDPDSVGLPNWFSDFPKRITSPPSQYSSAPLQKSSARLLAPLPFDKAYDGEGSCKKLIETMLRTASKSMVNDCDDSVGDSSSTRRRSSRLSNAVVQKEEPFSSSDFVKKEAFAKKSCGGKMVKGSVKDENDDSPMSSGNDYLKKEVVKREKIEFDGEPLSLEPHNVARVVPGRILVVKFIPCQNVISSSYDGLIRLMDVEKSIFDLVYSSDDAIFSLSQRPNDEQSLYFSEGYGMLNVWDLRAGKSVFNWDDLHEHRINTIDFSSQNPHVMATSSTDGSACLWDLRSMGATTPKTLKTVNHSRAVHSAYFSPSGLSLATTSVDNYIGLLSGTNFEDISMISHDNATNRWISTFRGVWGWDDSYIFVGNRPSKGIDVMSTKLKRTVKELQDPLMKAIPCRIHCHPLNVGVLAGSTAGGQVYVWTLK